jgi:hypothetical protein
VTPSHTETLDDSETCSTIYISQMHIRSGPPLPRLQVPAVESEKILFDLPYLSSQFMLIVLCKLSDTSENGGKPVLTLCKCKPRPSTRLPTDKSNLLTMLSLPPIPHSSGGQVYWLWHDHLLGPLPSVQNRKMILRCEGRRYSTTPLIRLSRACRGGLLPLPPF